MWLFALVIIAGIAAGGVILTAKESKRQGPSSPGASPPDDSNRNKKKLTGENEKLIGLDDPSFRYQTDQGANTGMTTVKFDTTTYGDRAVIQLRNETGSTRTMGDAAILGKPVIQMSGRSGYLWEYSDYDNIDKNGEKFVEVSNRFIISPSQCEDIGDYCWKKLAPHKMYNVTTPGCHPEYEPGDVWTLSGTYVINGVTVENINALVEIQSASVHRACLTPGETVLTCVLYDGAWSKTNSTRSRIVGAGKPQWMQNRSNVLVVASKDYTGQADYYCDGTDDDVQIQEAINKLGTIGGGEISLTYGSFNTSASISIEVPNISLIGEGASTIIAPNITSGAIIYAAENNIYISSIIVDGSLSSFTSNAIGISLIATTGRKLKLENVIIRNITSTTAVDGIWCYEYGYCDTIGCTIHDLTSGGIYNCNGIYQADRVNSCTIYNITASATATGVSKSKRCGLNRVGTLTGSSTYKYGTGGSQSYADAGTSYPCADTDAGGFNS